MSLLDRQTDVLAPLRGDGSRAWRRLQPTDKLPATAVLHRGGKALGAREVIDLSMGGLGVLGRRWEEKRYHIGDVILVELTLAGAPPIRLHARVVHIQCTGGWLRKQVSVGMVFDNSLAMSMARSALARYLLRLLR